jgi:serine/threonine-protein kinase
VLQNLLEHDAAERLREEAGELNVDSVGSFMLVRKLGEGGMGSVWLATDPHDRSVAVKVLSPDRARQRPMLTRFFREGQAAIRLQHPNLVSGLELGEDGGYYFYAMEFVAGRTVRELLDEKGRMECAESAGLVRQVASALAYAHDRNVVHRDIKPGNIIVTPEGRAKLADLGLAKYLDGDLTLLTHSGAGMGTPCYIAPEQIRDAKHADARSDIYSLGATWYHMVVGHPPFTGATTLEVCHKHVNEPLVPPSDLRADVPKDVSQLIQCMMAKDPADRLQTAAELESAIQEICRVAG